METWREHAIEVFPSLRPEETAERLGAPFEVRFLKEPVSSSTMAAEIITAQGLSNVQTFLFATGIQI